ncbi:MAG: hypothetical protein WCL44_13260 [bacterium]
MNNLRKLTILALLFSVALSSAAQFRISSFLPDGGLVLTNAFTNGVCTLRSTTNLVAGPFLPVRNVFTTTTVAQASNALTGNVGFYRPQAWDLSGGRAGFTNLTLVYGLLTTIAGAGGPPNTNNWLPQYEGGPATNAVLSGPHISIGDRWGRIYVAEKDGHAIRKISPDGTIVTVAGTNGPGNGPDTTVNGTLCALDGCNGLWVKKDGTVFILDAGNNKIRRLDTNGTIRTLFTVPPAYAIDRGLWVSENETTAYVGAKTNVLKWVDTVQVTSFSTNYQSLGNIVVDLWGNLVVADRYGNRVYRLDSVGNRTPIAGNGAKTGGGDGQLALNTGLEEVRGVWFMPTGAYLLCTHKGSDVWYVDTAGYNHLLLNGASHDEHAGDGTWFYNPSEYRVSKCRAVTMDYDGNILVTENDLGYVRKVRFLPLGP